MGRTSEHLRALMSRPLGDIRLAALMLDGIELKGRCCVVCLGVSTDGIKVPLGLWDGSTENKTVTKHLLSDLVDRGLDVEQGVLVVLDGSKALRAAVREVLGPVPVQRCVRHKERGVLDHLRGCGSDRASSDFVKACAGSIRALCTGTTSRGRPTLRPTW